MAVYAVGDVQGCYAPLRALLSELHFDPKHDRLWFTGDLVNRGPQSLEVLRFVRDLGERAVCVLGNHDLHLLAVAAGTAAAGPHDTLEPILNAPDRDELLAWLRTRRLLHHDSTLGYTLVHAGLLPAWDLTLAQGLAQEVEQQLRQTPQEFFRNMYGDQPDRWGANLRGIERMRLVVNVFTRLRYCTVDGRMDLKHKGAPGTQPALLLPWFQVPGRQSRDLRIVFGHWSTLGIWRGDGVIGLDSGCLWGRELTAVRLDAKPVRFFRIPCPVAQNPHVD